ncbi:hypothetical protein [Alkalicoccus daliensis]|uniref:Uncharacterized protein n=1 Tax=Alkalicoccus daliensis TaxID=745820 RepID=A0A1H0D3T0_9BACI|nr:hypothetical protein [Alkalicoccus daliensis]SDN64783.1 hypothetical protein SAMN04488053_102334 [Alkalicoccus daliensis]
MVMSGEKMIVLLLIFATILSGCNTEPPEAEVVVNDDTEISTFRGSYHWTEGAAEYDIPPQLVQSEELERTEVDGGSIGTIVFDDGSDPSISIQEWSENEPISELNAVNNEVTFPEDPGTYIFEISAEWEGDLAKSASYTLYVEIV